MAISPDNRWVVTGSEDNAARLWDLSAEDPAANPIVLRGHGGAVRAVAISPDSRWLVTGSWDNTARLWDLSAKDPAANPIERPFVEEGSGLFQAAVSVMPFANGVSPGVRSAL